VVVVDSSVWIDFFSGHPSPGCTALRRLLQEGEVELIVPDLVLFEVLRGFRQERDWRRARTLLESIGIAPVGGHALAVEAAQHYRSLRQQGVTVRSALDVLIATFCIERGYALLHADRDFDAFEDRRGLRGLRH
jgi:predicted nucleic acid-binding protein